MAFFGIGKKTPKAPSAPASSAPASSAPASSAPAKAAVVTKTSKASKPKVRGVGGELNIYTGVLAAAIVVLAAGCILIAMDNLSGVVGTSDEGNPLAVISSR